MAAPPTSATSDRSCAQFAYKGEHCSERTESGAGVWAAIFTLSNIDEEVALATAVRSINGWIAHRKAFNPSSALGYTFT